MKKHYINPEISIINVKLTQMIAASQLDSTSESQSVAPDPEVVIEEGFGSRRCSTWDD